MSIFKRRAIVLIVLAAVCVALVGFLIVILLHTSSTNNQTKTNPTKKSDNEIIKAVSYNQTVLNDKPVAFWPMGNTKVVEKDITSNGHNGTYKGNRPFLTNMPNNDSASEFSAPNQYLTIPSSPVFSVTTTHRLTWEAWIKPSTLKFSYASSSGYVEWMGKCQNYAPSCEWTARMYDSTNAQGRCDRLSAYIFNPSGAFWQPKCGEIQSNQWIYVVGEYDTDSTPRDCDPAYPGSINIWVDGIEWNQYYHGATGCMSEYSVRPQANNSPLNIGSASLDTWFQGAIGKVAIYNYALSQNQINTHYKSMTGTMPSGYCNDTCSLSY